MLCIYVHAGKEMSLLDGDSNLQQLVEHCMLPVLLARHYLSLSKITICPRVHMVRVVLFSLGSSDVVLRYTHTLCSEGLKERTAVDNLEHLSFSLHTHYKD